MAGILALDLGTHCGWACRTETQVTSGVERFENSRYSGGGMRFLRFRHWLEDMKGLTHGFRCVYFEEVRRHLGVDAAHVYGGFLATLTAFCEEQQIPYQGVPVGTIKRHVTGKGNASKTAVQSALTAQGIPFTDENEADALALLMTVGHH
ncbi:Putative crossover junction endodeoxyribonuclease RuvC domain protein (plasmid) [Candidatus Bealeia paramacronuclearis]|uniref:Crossover junction endodeoxyribonuclease RuvC domain protein n=1 Tax=Candidatus Bealeia paramacronuclearis TaxID=1921001 RepID=A0ABZ2C5M1_9PROT|nr:hypothetical protein [Candidatus Bealeia paramacronuclearis]